MKHRFLSTLMGSWVALALVVSGCTSCVRRDRVAVHNVLIDLPKQQQAALWSKRDALRPWVIAALHATGHVRLVSKPQDNSQVVRVQLQHVQQQGKPHVRVSVHIPQRELQPGEKKQYAVVQGELQEREQPKKELASCCWGRVIVSEEQLNENPKHVLHRAVVKAAKQMQQFKQCKPHVVAALIKQLQQVVTGQQGQKKGQERKTGIESILHKLGTCKVKQAATTIEQLLVLQSNMQVNHAALQALGRIGSADSVPVIIEFAHKQQEQKLMLQAIVAAGRIGGAQAAGWLFALSNGHEQAGIRRASAQALQQVSSILPHPQVDAVQ
ncbi:MAG: HEAT repeat domain-containing protein [Myxococcota bacterium]